MLLFWSLCSTTAIQGTFASLRGLVNRLGELRLSGTTRSQQQYSSGNQTSDGDPSTVYFSNFGLSKWSASGSTIGQHHTQQSVSRHQISALGIQVSSITPQYSTKPFACQSYTVPHGGFWYCSTKNQIVCSKRGSPA